MALTRKLLAALGIEESKIDQIVEAHSETVEALKKQRDGYKLDADKLADVQKQLDEANAKATANAGDNDKYDKLKKEFDDYKKTIEQRDAHAAKENAARAYLASKGIADKSLSLALKALGADLDALELDGDNIKDAASLDAALAGDLAPLVTTTETHGASTATPPASDGGGASGGGDIFGSTGSYFM